MASTYKHCDCPGCFETIVGDSDGVNLCDDCEAADCDPFGDVESGECNVEVSDETD
jgi:hypothetical protein